MFSFVEKRNDRFKLIWLQAYWNKIMSVSYSPSYTEALPGPSYESCTTVDVATSNTAPREDKLSEQPGVRKRSRRRAVKSPCFNVCHVCSAQIFLLLSSYSM